MEDTLSSFRKREIALRNKHVRMSQGYVTRMNRNGLIEQVPDRRLGGFGLSVLLRPGLALIGFKVLALVWLGDTVYAGHVGTLSQGAAHEQAGAWLMQIDPMTRMLADFVTKLIG